MRVETERSRNGYRGYSDRKYNDRFKRNNYRNNNHPYHSLRSRHHHHHNNNKDYSSNRIGNSYTDHRFDRQTNDDRDIYSTLLIDQPILSPPPPTDLYYSSSQSTRDRSYIDSERTRYSSNYRRESSPPPSSSSYRNDVLYQSPTNMSIRSSIDPYRTSDYANRSERYDISQNRNGSITTTTQQSPVYRSSSTYVTYDQYTPIREVDYRSTTSMDYHHSSYRDRSRSNFNENGSKRSMRR